MNREQIELLGEYIKARKFPVLIDKIPDYVIKKGAVVLKSDCSKSEFMGYFDNFKYVTPKWIEKLNESAKIHTPILIIENINKVPEKEQRKFIELLKYKKVYINKIPNNCMIFVTYSNLIENPIEKEVYSFLVHI